MASELPLPNLEELPPGALLTISDTASLLKVSGITVRRWSASGRLPPLLKIGPNSVRINAGELRAALAKLAA